ncbi:hypothetical protein, partial [Thiolapillus sp.]|uniref:hypothetical protein n=1 Tax=Thiolapillus sp. TaxID=2017437 RepID=UPI0025F78D7A
QERLLFGHILKSPLLKLTPYIAMYIGIPCYDHLQERLLFGHILKSPLLKLTPYIAMYIGIPCYINNNNNNVHL